MDKENIIKSEKQIAMFILLSCALAAPTFADGFVGANTCISMYSAPSYPVNGSITPITPDLPPLARYAGPVDPNTPIITEFNPIMARYAGPVVPDVETKVNLNQVQQNVQKSTVLPNVRTNSFINSEYGNIQIIEPSAHYIFTFTNG